MTNITGAIFGCSKRGRDLDELRVALADGDVNTPDQYGRLPLHFAITHGSDEILALVLEAGPDLETPDADGFGPLALAIHHDNWEAAQRLLEAGAKAEGSDGTAPPILVAAEWGRLEQVKALCARGAKLDCTYKHHTPFTAAASNKHVETATWLLDEGAPMRQDSEVMAPLVAAVASRSSDLLGRVLALVDDLDKAGVEQALTNAIVAAGSNQEPTAAHMLLEAGARTSSTRALEAAISNRHLDLAEEVVVAGGELDWDRVLLDMAGVSGLDAEVVQFLIGKGAALQRGERAQAPLHRAAVRGKVDNVRVLLEAGADIDEPDSDSKTALQIAVNKRWPEVVALLRARGAHDDDVAPGKSHTTSKAPRSPIAALHHAVEVGDVSLVESLLAEGMDVNALHKDRWGTSLTALHVAASRGHVEVVRTLLDAGADPRVVSHGSDDHEGLTPLHEAANLGHTEVCRLLLEHTPQLREMRSTVYQATAADLATTPETRALLSVVAQEPV